jgi:hypothetical protein
MGFQHDVLNLGSEFYNMKRFITLLSAVAFTAVLNAQNVTGNIAVAAPEAIALKETIYDFGTIPQGKPVYHSFEIFNTGKTPMVISNVQTSCGCTTPEWTKEPIAPGSSKIIKVGYNAAAEGHFEKFITITYNQNLNKQVKITGTVWKSPEGSAPANSSITLLKQKNNY